MKILQYILYFLGLLLLLVNTFSITLGFANFYNEFSNLDDPAEKIGYAIGSVLFFFIGFLFLLISSRINRKLKSKKKARELLSTLPQ